MDKNLVNIDDLVRQRLGGGEEQERAGSWGRMSELLDKEMPQRPVGMYWRRTLSAVGVILLITAISFGGYQLGYIRDMVQGNGDSRDIAATGTSGVTASADVAKTSHNAENNSTTVPSTTNEDPTASAEALSGAVATTNNANTNGVQTKGTSHKHNATGNTTKITNGATIAATTEPSNSTSHTNRKTRRSNTVAQKPVEAATLSTNNTLANNVASPDNANQPTPSVVTEATNTSNQPIATVGNNKAGTNETTSSTAGKHANMKELALGSNVPSANGNTAARRKKAGAHNTAAINTVTGVDVAMNTPGADHVNESVDNKATVAHKSKTGQTTKQSDKTVLAMNSEPVATKQEAISGATNTTGIDNNPAPAKTKIGAARKQSNKHAIGNKQETATTTEGAVARNVADADGVSIDNNVINKDVAAENGQCIDKVAVTGRKETAKHNKTTTAHKLALSSNATVAKSTVDADKMVNADNGAVAKHAKSSVLHKSANKQQTISGNAVAQSTTPDADNVATSPKAKTGSVHKKAGSGILVLNSGVPTAKSNPDADNIASTPKAKTGNAHKKSGSGVLALNNSAPTNNSTPNVSADVEELSDNKKAANTKNKRTSPANKVPAQAVAVNVPAKKIAAKQPKSAIVPAATIGTGNSKMATAKTTIKKQKQVSKLVVAEHYIKTSATEWKLQLDTISMETVMEDYELANMLPFGPPPYDAEEYETTSLATVAKESNHSKQSSGSKTLENLSAAFNEIKTKMKGTRFVPGITGGINGTFFGPNSFKGFQFGFTGSFIFSENVSLMGELKYFNRINNNYSLNDDYYAYTPASAGGYNRVLVMNPYSFSTIHSVEMPIALRYSAGNFNFFMGGNMVYTLPINTGAYPLVDPNSVTTVASIDNSDNAPKVKQDDFSSRFCVGYLVGASYKVSSNVTLDFRNVQTIWDNGKTDGSKIVSTQLYRSPSLQLSIGYRLGGRKDSEKE